MTPVGIEKTIFPLGKISNYEVYYSANPLDHIQMGIGAAVGEGKFIVGDSKDLDFYEDYLISEKIINRRRKLKWQ